MPYIPPENRPPIDCGAIPRDVGELTYLLTQNVLAVIDSQGESFANYAAAIAALECTKLELYRRRVARYEDAKCALNGDVY